jgi:hypothetical protein
MNPRPATSTRYLATAPASPKLAPASATPFAIQAGSHASPVPLLEVSPSSRRFAGRRPRLLGLSVLPGNPLANRSILGVKSTRRPSARIAIGTGPLTAVAPVR